MYVHVYVSQTFWFCEKQNSFLVNLVQKLPKLVTNELTSVACDTSKDDPSHADCPNRPMHRSIETSHSIREMDVTISSVI